ncbi:hypothetical protein FACS1894187_12600 [Synergistales bacterium]|nr:hypothetical protein FACS1894187_12600 [Synergistales bacterium]
MLGELLFCAAGVLFGIACVANLLFSGRVEVAYDLLGSRSWPMVLIVAIIILLVVNIVKVIKKNGGIQVDKTKFLTFGMVVRHKLLHLILLLAIYVVLLNQIGFLVLTPFYMYLNMWLMGQKSFKIRVIVCIVGTIVLYALFMKFLQIPLPRGFGIFRELSLVFETL